MYESIEEAKIYNFYDEGESIQEGVVDALKKFVDKIKKALVALIEKLEKLLSKGKDNKVKSTLKELLGKAKAALNKTNSVNSKEDARALSKEAKECKEEFDKLTNISEQFKEYVKAKDMTAIKSALYTALLFDPSFSTNKFDSMVHYAISNGIDLYDDESGIDIEEDEVKWTENYWHNVASSLVDHFNKKVVSHLKKVSDHMYNGKDFKSFKPD